MGNSFTLRKYDNSTELKKLCAIYDRSRKYKILEKLLYRKGIFKMSQLLQMKWDDYQRLFDRNLSAELNKCIAIYFQEKSNDKYSKKFRGEIDFVDNKPVFKRGQHDKKDN